MPLGCFGHKAGAVTGKKEFLLQFKLNFVLLMDEYAMKLLPTLSSFSEIVLNAINRVTGDIISRRLVPFSS